jgi:hypothetical protein
MPVVRSPVVSVTERRPFYWRWTMEEGKGMVHVSQRESGSRVDFIV